MKPRFEDFKLQFVGPHMQVPDTVPKATTSAEPDEMSIIDGKPLSTKKPEKKEDGFVDFSTIARERDASQAMYKERHFAEEHPRDIHGGRFSYDGPHIMDESDYPLHDAKHNRD